MTEALTIRTDTTTIPAGSLTQIEWTSRVRVGRRMYAPDPQPGPTPLKPIKIEGRVN